MNSFVEKLLAAVELEYRNDSVKPGLILSLVNSKSGKYYAAIHRYGHSGIHYPQIIAKCYGKTLNDTVRELASVWLGHSAAKEELRKAL